MKEICKRMIIFIVLKVKIFKKKFGGLKIIIIFTVQYPIKVKNRRCLSIRLLRQFSPFIGFN